jgi:predicted PurR-regulated permease PerM
VSNDNRTAPRASRQVTFWLVAGAVLVLLWVLGDVLLPFVLGAVIAYFLNPLADRLGATGMGRTPASALIILFWALTLLLAIILIGPLVFDQIRQLADTLPDELRRLRSIIQAWAKGSLGERYDEIAASLERGLSDAADSWSGSMKWMLGQLWSRGLALFNLLSLLLITPVVAFYLLADWPRVMARLDEALPRDHAPTIRRLTGEINAAVSAFVRGQGTISLILAAIYAIGLTLIGVRYGLLIGLTAGLLSFVPLIGGVMGISLAVGMAAAQSWPDVSLLIKVVVLFVAAAALETAVLSPKIVGSKVGLHPVWLIFSVLAFGSLFGFTGVLIAVPVAAAIAVLVRFALSVYLDSAIYRGQGETDVPVVAPAAPPAAVANSVPQGTNQ